NESIDAAIALVATVDDPPSRVIIAHADLPLADDLRVVDGPGLAIAPDQARDGSNVLSIPLTSGFTFHYGPGSFAAHCAEAERLGLEITVVDDPSLALDVDDPGDLAHLPVEGS
ncbi:MAG: 2-phospho-L-lactate guanylyltransferase, partial [Actinomycetota bacterium]|nr:2-phospho-L-lactate guanylyltransferase [Actinomycetota bacterium]